MDITTPNAAVINKAVISDYAEQIIQEVIDGNFNAMDVQLQIKFFDDLITKLKERLRPHVIDELNKYPSGQEIIKHNAVFAVKEAGVRYDYTNCNDPLWNDLKEQADLLDKEIKDRERFLKTIPPSGLTITDERTGEIVTLHPPVKTSTTTPVITWKH